MVVRRLAREYLRELRAQHGHTVALAILDDSEVSTSIAVKVSRRGQYAIDLGVGLGSRLPVHCSAAGKALLGYMPEAEQREAIAKLRLTRRTANTIVTKTALRAELAADRLPGGGLAVEDEELLVGRRALAAPVFDEQGLALAAVELAASTEAYTRKQLVEQLGPTVSDRGADHRRAQLERSWPTRSTRSLRAGRTRPLRAGAADALGAYAPRARAITICCTSSVPSPIVRILASR